MWEYEITDAKGQQVIIEATDMYPALAVYKNCNMGSDPVKCEIV